MVSAELMNHNQSCHCTSSIVRLSMFICAVTDEIIILQVLFYYAHRPKITIKWLTLAMYLRVPSSKSQI